MHAARAGVAARLAPGSLSASSSRRLASARPLLWPRCFAIAAPSRAVLDTGSQSTPQEESLAGRLRQRRPSERTPASESPSADSQTLSADASTSQDAATALAEKIQRPHKLRKPKAPADRTKKDEKGGVPPAAHTPSRREMRRKQAAAPIEGFRAKRFAMLKMRREQVQAMQEANGSEDWLTDDHTHPKNPYELGTEYYLRRQSHLPVKDQLRLFRARLALVESLRQPWSRLGKQERQFEVTEYEKVVRAREKRREGAQVAGAAEAEAGTEAAEEGAAPASDIGGPSSEPPPPDFDAMAQTHAGAAQPAEPAPHTSKASTAAPARPRGNIAAERERTWPAVLEQMDGALALLKDRIASLVQGQQQEKRAPSPPSPSPPRARAGPSLLDQIAETVTSSPQPMREVSKTKGRTPRGQNARAISSNNTNYDNHPALSPSNEEHDAPASREDPPLRDLSSYQHVLSPASTQFVAHPAPYDVPVARLAHSLDRVLFNPGVHFLRDPRTGVYNFRRTTLEHVPKIEEFMFDKLPQYVTSSRDETLKEIAKSQERRFVGSTSSTVGMLCQIYFWLSKGKKVNLDMLSSGWQSMARTFSMGQQLPVSVVLRYEDGRYAIDADKSFDPTNGSNVLADYGHLMEKLLTTEADEFKRFLVDAEDPAPSEAGHRQAYHYSLTDKMVLRSQLDATNEHLPNKTFDLKTRGTVAIRQDRLNYEESAGYTIDRLQGEWESFEREYYDLIRSAFLKYQFQARIGGMDGIFVAYHSTTRFFGFQYLPISVMDEALFGTTETGEQGFRLALGVLERALEEASRCYPGESVNVTWANDTEADVLRLFVAPQREIERVEANKREGAEGAVEVGETSTPEAQADEVDHGASSAPGGEGEASAADADEPSSAAPEMTLFELRGTNYIDGEKQSHPVTIYTDRGPPNSPAPVWQVGFDIVKSTGAEGDAVAREQIASLFAETRSFQRMFSSLALPTGISPADVQKAAERAQEAGVELDESDLSVRFPLGEGIEYRGPSRPVKILRRKAREGEERRKADEQRRLQEGGGKEKVVEVKSYIEVREE